MITIEKKLKTIGIAIMTLIICITIIPIKSVSANINFSGGILDGIAPSEGAHQGVYSMTDNNTETENTFVGSINPHNLFVGFGFDNLQKITGVRMLADSPTLGNVFTVAFYSDIGSLIYTKDIVADGSFNDISVTAKKAAILLPKPNHTYTIKEFNLYGEGYDPDAIPTAPPTPTNLVANAGDKQVTLTWDHEFDDTQGYYIYMDDTLLDNTKDKSYTIYGLSNDVEYAFKIAAYNSIGKSAYTDTVYATPSDVVIVTPKSPKLHAKAKNNKVELTWSNVFNADYYIIYRNNIEIDTTTINSYIDKDVINDTTYTYTVSAVNDSGESAQSNTVTVTPKVSIFENLTIPFSVLEFLKVVFDYLAIYAPWILLALSIYFAPQITMLLKKIQKKNNRKGG